MGGLKVCFLAILVLVALLSSSSANPAPRIKTEVKSDKDSDHYNELLYGDERSYQNRVHNPLEHIVNRLERYFVFGGTLQAIAEYTELQREGLVQGGAVLYQDRNSEVPGTHAAHVIRVGEINSELWNTNETLFNATRNYIGHTQNVIIDANKFWGIGGELDRFQSSRLTVLNEIDFRSTFAVQSLKVRTLVNSFMEVIHRYPMPWDQQQLSIELLVTPEDPSGELMPWGNQHEEHSISIEGLFNVGKMGYEEADEWAKYWALQ